MDRSPVHFSNLKRMSLSPAHYLYAVQTGVAETRAMRIGSVVHAIVLGGKYHVYDGDRRGNSWKEFAAEHADGHTIATGTEYEEALKIATAVLTDPVVRELVTSEGETEKHVLWSYLGRECSSRMDLVLPRALVEVKVSNTASPDLFPRHALRMFWHAQLAFYLQALARPLDSAAYIIAVESSPPYPVTVLQLTDRALDYGDRLCRLWMERLLVCEASNEWPAYAQSVVPLDVPSFDDELTLTVGGEEIAL